MQRLILLAAILLIIQVGLVVAFTTQNKGFNPFTPNAKVVSFDPRLVDTIRIKGEDGELKITKSDENWLLSPTQGVPANGQQVEKFLKNISEFKKGLAVATSKSAAKRFKVSPENFAHHLVLIQEEKEMANLYFGTSPGFKQTHLRLNDSDEIITVALGSHLLTPKVEQWIDKDLLKLDKKKIHKIEVQDRVYEQNEEMEWTVSGGDDMEMPDKEDVDSMLEKICSLSVNNYISDSEAVSDEEKQALSFSLTLADQGKLDWQFKQVDDNSYSVKRSDLDYLLNVSKWQVDEIMSLIEKDQTDSVDEERVPENEKVE